MAITWMQLKDLRSMLGVTQAEFAKIIGVHPKTIVNWESNDVPANSAYKVYSKFRDQLSYLSDQRLGVLGDSTTFEEWKEDKRSENAYWDEYYRREEESLTPEEQSAREVEAQHYQELYEEQSRASEQVHKMRTILSQFTSIQLLNELSRREERRAYKPLQSPSVGGLSQDDLHGLDLSQGDVELAATNDTSAVQDQTHPSYENESQDTEE